MSGKWSQGDLDAISLAIDLGTITDRHPYNADEMPESRGDAPFPPFSFPAELRFWGSTRAGDIEVKFTVPNKWREQITPLQLALRKRLVVTVAEWES